MHGNELYSEIAGLRVRGWPSDPRARRREDPIRWAWEILTVIGADIVEEKRAGGCKYNADELLDPRSKVCRRNPISSVQKRASRINIHDLLSLPLHVNRILVHVEFGSSRTFILSLGIFIGIVHSMANAGTFPHAASDAGRWTGCLGSKRQAC